MIRKSRAGIRFISLMLTISILLTACVSSENEGGDDKPEQGATGIYAPTAKPTSPYAVPSRLDPERELVAVKGRATTRYKDADGTVEDDRNALALSEGPDLRTFMFYGWGHTDDGYISIAVREAGAKQGDSFTIAELCKLAETAGSDSNGNKVPVYCQIYSNDIVKGDWPFMDTLPGELSKTEYFCTFDATVIIKTDNELAVSFFMEVDNKIDRHFYLEGVLYYAEPEKPTTPTTPTTPTAPTTPIGGGDSGNADDKPTVPQTGTTTCTHCGGSGYTMSQCFSCSGRGKVSCSSCSGRGKKNCTRCGGDGYRYDALNGKDVRCTNCFGSGRISCSTCHGTGKVECSQCSGKGQVKERCIFCSGTGSR